MKYYELNFKITPAGEQDACDLLAAFLGEAGFEAFEDTPQGMKAYIQQQLYDDDAVRQMVEDFPMAVQISYSAGEASYENWNEQWESEGFEPIVIGEEICVHDTRHLPAQDFAYDITINPRMAFGSGTHPTTQMLLHALTQTELKGRRVMDAGCGTGVLGILSLMRGAESVLAYDIDEWSTQNAELNFGLNGMTGNVQIRLGDSSVIKEEKSWDLILANINRNILIADMPVWRSTLAEGGRLMVSGFYEQDAPFIVAEAEKLGLREIGRRVQQEWCLLLLG